MKNKKLLIRNISVVLFTLSIVVLFAFHFYQKQDKVFYNDNKSVLTKTYFSQSDENATEFILIKNPNSNRLMSFELMLKQNNINFITAKINSFLNESQLKAINEKIIENSKAENIIFVMEDYKNINLLSEIANINGLILIEPNQFSELFFVNYPTFVFSTTVSSKSNPQTATNIYNELTNQKLNATGFAFNSQKGNYSLNISSEAFETNKPISKNSMDIIKSWLNNNLNLNFKYFNSYVLVEITVYIALISFILIFTLTNWFDLFKNMEQTYTIIDIVVVSPIKFLLTRFLVWALSLLVLAIFALILWNIKLLPFNSALIFAFYLFSSGIIMCIIYKLGKMPGVDGNLNSKNVISVKKWAYGKAFLLISPILLMAFAVILNGFFTVNFNPDTLIISAVFSALVFPGFFIYFRENKILNEIEVSGTTKIIYKIELFIPLILISLVCIPLGYTTWLYASYIQLVAFIMVILTGKAVCDLTDNIYFSATIQSVIFGMFLGTVSLI